MKKINTFFHFSIILALSLIINACEQNNEEQLGNVDFGMSSAAESNLKSLTSDSRFVYAALVTITNEFGEKIFDKEFIEFYSFGDSYVTKSLSLGTGSYKLTEFLLVDSSKIITWASPVEGSRLAELVNDPLPIEFEVFANTTTHLNPEVLRVADHKPGDFGYINFNVTFVDGFCIEIFYESPCSDWIYLDSVVTDNGEFTYPYYPSKLVISSDGRTMATYKLYPGSNNIHIPKGPKQYRITVYDCGNNLCFNEIVGVEELKRFSCKEGNALNISCIPNEPNVLITPEEISEPTIDQGVFGKISEGYWSDSVLNNAGSSIMPLVSDLYIYKYEPEDSLFLTVPEGDCYYYPENYRDPLAAVRTNSRGYFQVPLEAGEYTYLVRSPYGFYVNTNDDSANSGKFKVVLDSVTALHIQVISCVF